MYTASLGGCLVLWAVVGIAKTLQPQSLHFGNRIIEANWAVGIGVAEVLIALGLTVRRTRTQFRVLALLIVTGLGVASFVVPTDGCGCLGRVRLDLSARRLLIAAFLAAHGLELLFLAKAKRPSQGAIVT